MSDFFAELPRIKPEVMAVVQAWRGIASERMLLAKSLAARRHAIGSPEFYSWQAVQESLLETGRGIFSGGVDVEDLPGSLLANAESGQGEDRLLVGVSGGADSVALLLISVICTFGTLFSGVTCCHVNHRMRGEESDLDAQYCAELCKKLPVDFVSTVATNEQALLFQSQGGENALREFRYAAFEKHAKGVGARIVAVAHTLNDQVETLLFRAFRGTSAAGLRGIPCVRWHNDVLICRPLIDVSRAQITSLLKDLGVGWREDSSNKQLHYARNFIRAEIIPRIESEFPDFGSRIENMRQLLADDEELLKALCLSQISEVEGKSANSWQLAKLNPLSTALKRRMFAQAMKSRGIEVSFERVEKLVTMTAGNNEVDLDYSNPEKRAISLNERWDVVIRKDYLMFVDKEEAKETSSVVGEPIPVRVPGMTIVAPLNKAMFVEALEGAERKPKKFPSEDSFEAIVSLEKVKGPFVLRERQPGDYIQPFGMQETVKLKKYLHTHKPEEEEPTPGKRKLFVLAIGEEVLWVPGVGISEKLRVTGQATHCLKLLDIGLGESTFC